MSAEPFRTSAYSPDIGWRVVWQRVGMGLPIRDVAARLGIGTSTAHRIFQRFQESGEIAPKQPCRNDARILDDRHELFILGILMENPSLYLREICPCIFQATGVKVSESTVCRVLHRNKLTRKKIQQVAKQRCTEFRAAFMAQVLQFDRDFFVWIDETGSDARSHIRKFGYSLHGQAPIYHRLLVRGQRVSAIAAISTDGLLDVELTTGSVNADKFEDFVRGSVIPNMHPFDGTSTKSIAILDNCKIHHAQGVKDLFEDAGIILIYLPPYSPDYNPIEEAFSSVKYYLKDHDELLQSVDDPCIIIQAAFENISSENCNG